MHAFKYTLIVCALILLVMGAIPRQVRAQDSCEEGKEVIGLSLTPPAGKESDKPLGLLVSSVAPLGFASRLGLRVGDVIEQANSWLMRDCRSYRQAITDARKGKKALLVLVAREGKRQAVAFEAAIWKEPEKKAKEATASLKTLLEAPLPPPLKGKVGPVGEEVVLAMRGFETSAYLPGHLSLYEQSLSQVKAKIAALDRSVQGEAEKRVIAGAQVILDYYLAAQEIWQHKLERLAKLRPDLRQGEQAAYSSPFFPYFFNSPVLAWVDRYPFLKASVATAPRKERFLERPGEWNPDQAILLLWQKAKEETDNLSQWLKGTARSG